MLCWGMLGRPSGKHGLNGSIQPFLQWRRPTSRREGSLGKGSSWRNRLCLWWSPTVVGQRGHQHLLSYCRSSTARLKRWCSSWLSGTPGSREKWRWWRSPHGEPIGLSSHKELWSRSRDRRKQWRKLRRSTWLPDHWRDCRRSWDY